MYLRQTLFSLLAILLSFSSQAQEACGTEVDEEQVKLFLEKQEAIAQFYHSETKGMVTQIPVQHTFVRTTAGTGGPNPIVLPYIMDGLNELFAPANIEFIECEELRFIDNDTYYNFTSSQENGFGNKYDINGVINIYYFNNVTSGSTPVCGYTRLPPSPDRIMISKDCANPSTVNHEMGHFLSLYHTHGTTNFGTTDELVDGSNCNSKGDFICDTPADPNLQSLVDPDCKYTGTAVDANNDAYVPMVNNIMSYARSACRDTFTNAQLNQMEWSALNDRNYLVCPPSCRMNVDSLLPVSCFDGADGYVALSSEDANAYYWSDGFTGAIRSNVKPGSYIIVSNGTGCQDSLYLEIENPPGLEFNKDLVIASCNGTADGSVDVSIQGGTSYMSPNHSVLNSSLQVWLRSDKGMSNDAFGNLSQWVDYSGKGHHMSQTNYKLRPQIDTIIKDSLKIAAVKFNNSGINNISKAKRLQSNGTFNLQTVMMVLQIAQPISGSGPFGQDNGDKGFRINGQSYSNNNVNFDISYVQNSTPVRVNSEKTLVRPGSGTEELHMVILETSSLVKFNPNNKLSLGGFGSTVDAQFDGNLVEFVVFDRVLNLREKEGLERYLSDRYQLDGPSDVGASTYLWNTGDAADTNLYLHNVYSDEYILTVTDGYGCQYFDTTVIKFKKNLVLLAASGDGSIDITAYNATEPVTYIWSTGDTTEDLNDLEAGTYTVTLVDADSCWEERTVDLWATGVRESKIGGLKLHPQPSDHSFVIELEEQLRFKAVISVYTVEGQLILSESLGEGQNSLTVSTSDLESGLYILSYKSEASQISQKITVLH